MQCVIAAPGKIERQGAIDALLIRRDTLERTIDELVPDSPWADSVARLRCLRGIDTLSAVGLCAEIGDWQRFPRAGHLMSYLGLVPSEDSTGQTRRQGSITKTGSGHGRRAPNTRRRGPFAASPGGDARRAWSCGRSISELIPR